MAAFGSGGLAMVWIELAAVLQAVATPAYFPPSYDRLTEKCDWRDAPLARFDSYRREWYANHLRAAGEPSLLSAARAGQADTLRFVWLRTFDPPVIVRIEGVSGRRPRLIGYELTGAGGYEPGTVARKVDRLLTAAEASDLRRRLVVNNPLRLPAGSANCDTGTDGSQWIIERASGHRYKMVDRWSPDTGPVRGAGMAMLRLTGWKFTEIY